MYNLFKAIKEKPEIPPLVQPSHLPSLDGFRAISILMVLAGHLFGTTIFTGGFGVKIFFVISGFLITTLLLKEKTKTGTISLKHFYLRRALRIFPVAYLFLAVVVLLNYLFHLDITARNFISCALYLRNTSLISERISGPTGHFWSLSVEEQFYLFFPFFLKKSTRFYLFLIIAFIIIIPIASNLDYYHYIHSAFLHLFSEVFRYMNAILVGSLFAILVFFGAINENLIPRYKMLASLLLLLLASLFCDGIIHLPTIVGEYIGIVMIAVVILINLGREETNLFYKLLNTRAMAYLGTLSYSIYIWQQIFTLHRPWQGISKVTDSIILNLLALAIVSYLSYTFYEKRFLKLKNRFK